MLTKLTDSQLVILSSASARDTCHVLPLPASLTLNKGSAALVIKSLIARGLVAEVAARSGEEIWREQDDGRRVTLRLTQAALHALGVENDDTSLTGDPDRISSDERARNAGAASEGPAATVFPAPGTKQAIILRLLGQEHGASLAEIGSATGWQAHSVRGAISGMIRKKLGLEVETFAIEGRGKVYRVATSMALRQPEEAAR